MRTPRVSPSAAAAVLALAARWRAELGVRAGSPAVPRPRRAGTLRRHLTRGLPGPSSEPLAQCQWNLALIDADEADLGAATAPGPDRDHRQAASTSSTPTSRRPRPSRRPCSFVRSDDPTIVPASPTRWRPATATARTRPPCRTAAATAPTWPRSAPPGQRVGVAGVAPGRRSCAQGDKVHRLDVLRNRYAVAAARGTPGTSGRRGQHEPCSPTRTCTNAATTPGSAR